MKKNFPLICRLAAMAVCLLSVTGASAQYVKPVFDKKTNAMMLLNTTTELAAEELVRTQADSIKTSTLDMMTSVLVRQNMNDLDMAQRKDLYDFRRESRIYRKLVYEAQRFITTAAEFCQVVSRNPVNTAYCYRHLAELSVLAKQEVKNAVVFGMDGKVPNPFKVNFSELLEGKVDAPDYREDADRDKEVFKSYNLLLPDERLTIVNGAIDKLKEYSRQLRRVTWKIQYHTGFRQALRQTAPYTSRMLTQTEFAVNEVLSDIDRAGGLFK